METKQGIQAGLQEGDPHATSITGPVEEKKGKREESGRTLGLQELQGFFARQRQEDKPLSNQDARFEGLVVALHGGHAGPLRSKGISPAAIKPGLLDGQTRGDG